VFHRALHESIASSFAFGAIFNLHPGKILWSSFIIVADCCEQDCLVGSIGIVEFASLFAFETFSVEVPCGTCVLASSVVVERGRSEWYRGFVSRRGK